MLKYLIYFGFVITDIIIYAYLSFNNFIEKQKDSFEIISLFTDPLFIGCIVLSFALFRKTNYTQACAVAAIPVLISAIFFFILH